MLLKVLLTAFSLTLASCAGAPAKPVVTIGVIDYPANQVIENNTSGKAMKQIKTIAQATHENVVRAVDSAGSNRVPLSVYDNAVCFRPLQWEIVQNYLDALRTYVTNHCSTPAP